jgi:1-hydroxycarotenoid 3,4-desaturase
MTTKTAIVIGAGIGGLVSAVELASAGLAVTVCEAAATPGGKMRQVNHDGALIDAGPTVLTLRGIFDDIFARAGTSLDAHVHLQKLDILARHFWDDAVLDLHADRQKNIAAISAFAGPNAARLFADFTKRAARVFETLDETFMRAPQPGLPGLIRNAGARHLPGLLSISPFTTLWDELGKYFPDARLRQLFGRYATYSGASPFLAPATLMLIADAEAQGVWRITGGMQNLANSLARLAESQGALFRYGCKVSDIETQNGRAASVRLAGGETLPADVVVANADAAALAAGLFGAAAVRAVAPEMRSAKRSLSALTWAVTGETSGAELQHHNVFFSADYKAEFAAIAAGRLPSDPTVNVCAQDQNKFLILVNAKAAGDTNPFSESEIAQCWTSVMRKLHRAGVALNARQMTVTGPTQFEALFPATGGALYGRSLQGWRDPFRRPGSASRLPGLYLAGGSAHPGPGIPMAAISGQLAARRILEDLGLIGQFRPAATPGGISTRSAMTAPTP